MARDRSDRAHVVAVALLGVLAAARAVSAAEAPPPAAAAPTSPSSAPPPAACAPVVAVLVKPDATGAEGGAASREVWDALRAVLQEPPAAGARVEVREGEPAPNQPWLRVQGGVVRVGAIELLALSAGFDPVDGRPDLSVEVQGRRFDATISREWLALPAIAVPAERSERNAKEDGRRAVAADVAESAPVAFLRGVIAYLAYRRLTPAPACAAQAEALKIAAITSLRAWDGPRQEEIAADASAVSKQLRAFLRFGDDGCSAYDAGEDPPRLLIAAARLAPHRSESRRLAVMAQLHRADHPAGLCGATLERDLLASVAIAPGDQGALRDAGLAYDVLAQGPPRAFAAGQEVNRVEALRQMRRVPEAYRPPFRGFHELGLGGLASFGGAGIVPGGRVEIWLGPAVLPVALRAAVEVTASRNIPIDNSISDGAGAFWRRDALSLGIGYRLGTLGPFVNLFADGALASTHIDGHDFAVTRQTTNLDAGVGAGARAGWRWGRVALSAEVVDQFWLIQQSAEVEGVNKSYILPRSDLSVALLVSFAGGIKLK